jgi:hypothetical protein
MEVPLLTWTRPVAQSGSPRSMHTSQPGAVVLLSLRHFMVEEEFSTTL